MGKYVIVKLDDEEYAIGIESISSIERMLILLLICFKNALIDMRANRKGNR